MQKRRAHSQGAGFILSCLLLCGLPNRAWAQVAATMSESTYLGDWLVRNRANEVADEARGTKRQREDLYTRALMWTRPLDKSLQDARWHTLLSQLRYLTVSPPLSDADREGVYKLIASKQPTGRVIVSSGEGRWLEANPPMDPKLSAGDTITIPLRPNTVTVIREDGALCRVPYKAEAEAVYYIRACAPRSRPDTAWVAQPDGTLNKLNVGLWNEEKQTPVAPGAWIWAPDRASGWPEVLSDRIGQFFASQPPSGLEEDGHAVSNPNVPANNLSQANRFATYKSEDLQITKNDWGTEGLLQTPSARMGNAGEASIGISYVNPYTRLNVMLQPLSWLEFGFRYTDIANHRYGDPSFSGGQSYKDKSIDAKVRLWSESTFIPQVAVGFVDIGGTGLFSSEYLVASKRTGGFDWSLGVAWGYLGARGDISNPLSIISDKFKTRPAGSSNVSGAGSIGKSYFRGPMSLFGGVQYQLPNWPLVLKVEYDGNNYENDPFQYNAHARLPINLGLVYRLNKNIDVSAGFERGNRAMLGVTLHGNLADLGNPKVNDPPHLPVVTSRPSTDIEHTDWTRTSADLEAQTKWRVRDISRRGQTLTVSFDSPEAFYRKDLLDRVATVLHRDAPAEIDIFRVVTVVQGKTVRAYTIRRAAWVKSKTQFIPDVDREPLVVASAPPTSAAAAYQEPVFDQPYKRFFYSFGPGYSQTLGGPNGFVLYSISASLNAAFRVTEDTWVAGGLTYRLLDNYGHFTYTAPSDLPRVRTYMREYMTTSRFNIPYLQTTHVGKIGENQYFSIYAGLLESMFGGVGAEWLYRPAASPFAIGIDVNAVRQRDFNQEFGFRSYKTLTGHLTGYWDTGWDDVLVKLSVGQYLAKDKGATLDISRRFQNGVAIGAYATKTNISSAEFGEGSFDKGIYIQIPFDAIMGRSIGGTANLVWQPLTRDGGAKLNRQFPLYDLTDERSAKSLWYQPGSDASKR